MPKILNYCEWFTKLVNDVGKSWTINLYNLINSYNFAALLDLISDTKKNVWIVIKSSLSTVGAYDILFLMLLSLMVILRKKLNALPFGKAFFFYWRKYNKNLKLSYALTFFRKATPFFSCHAAIRHSSQQYFWLWIL